jgi:putative transposase
MKVLPVVPLPASWTEHAKSGALHAMALARFALMHVRGWCANSRIDRVRLAAERDEAVAAAAQWREEARVLRTRLEKMAAKERPHYAPEERLAILLLRAAAGWTAAETARRFLVSAETVASWMKRLDEEGPKALVKAPVVTNKFPEYVAEVVRRLRALQPSLGKVRIADVLARAGLHLSPTTARRMLAREPAAPPPSAPAPEAAGPTTAAIGSEKTSRRVTARYPHHVWNVDITLLPRTGWWVPWLPQSLAQRAPFCAWLVVVLDHFSRSVVAWKLFGKEPTAAEVCGVLDAGRRSSGTTPKYIVSDQGVQFRDEYKAWCQRRGVKPRFGAVGEHGSIAVLERFFRSLKTEMLRRLPWVPLTKRKLAAEVGAYVCWYHEQRPHQGLGGRTPDEVRRRTKPARERRRLEPRAAYPLRDRSAVNTARRVTGELVLVVDHFQGRPHLPVVSLRRAA